MIIIEGCDKTGKTTLAKELSDETGMDIAKFNVPKKNPHMEYVQFLLHMSEPMIFDRFSVGEFVYPIVFNRTTSMTRRHHRTIELMLRTLGSVVVHTTTSSELVSKKFIEDCESLNDVRDVDLTMNLFDLYFEEISIMPSHQFDYGRSDTNKFIKEIVEGHRERMSAFNFEDRHRLLKNGYQGEVETPELLFVGEIVNQNGIGRSGSRPFDISASSDVLFRSIHKITTDYGIINMLTPNGKSVDMERVVSTVRPNRVVALGNKVFNHLRSLELDVHTVSIPHPGWAKRFMNIKMNQSMYDDIMREAVGR